MDSTVPESSTVPLNRPSNGNTHGVNSSSVDTGTEQEILEALQRRKGRQTTLIIAHRLSSVMHADRIMVLDQGRVVQLGDHASLVTQPGPYRRLCEIQGALDASIRRDVAKGTG